MTRALIVLILTVVSAWPASAQTVVLPSPLPEVVRVEWDHNPANTQEYFLEVNGTRVSLGPASFLSPSSVPIPGRPASDPAWRYSVVLMANARALFQPAGNPTGIRQVRLVAQTGKYMKDGVLTVDEVYSPLLAVEVKVPNDTPPPAQYPITGFTITFTGSITVSPK